MKGLKLVYNISGVIPFMWLLNFLAMLGYGTFHLGGIPKYGNPIDPSALGIDWMGWIDFFLFIGLIYAFFFHIVINLYILKNHKEIRPNKIITLLFSIGIIGFFLFRFVFTSAFEWVMD